MMKVLVLVDHAIGISGPHRNVVSSLNALSARSDIELCLLTGKIDKNEPYANHCEIQLGFEPHNVKKVFKNLRVLRKAVKDRDLIYVPTGLKSFLYAFLLKRKHKLVAGPNVTGIPFLMNPANPSPLMTIYMSDAWIEMSEHRVQLCVSAGTPRSRIYLVPHAINTERFSPDYCDKTIWHNYKLDPNVTKIVYVGNMDKELKGVHQLIQAFSLLQTLCPENNIHLILIGQEGVMLTDEHKRVPNVHAIGPHYGNDLITLLASADIFMAASRWESFWYTPLEAMSCGLPVVVSTAGAVPTMIPEDGVQGRAISIVDSNYQYYPDAAELLAKAALPLVLDKALRLKMGQTARKYVIDNFSEGKQGVLLAQVLRQVLNPQR